ncbi:hypothetical protein JD969_13235 [Planctomycetota bacterium]|nr:hypothetical protein JD969_13235 [Planctomycetota bacterium]
MKLQSKINLTYLLILIISLFTTLGCETTSYVISEPESDPVWGTEYGNTLTAGVAVIISSQDDERILQKIKTISDMNSTTDQASALLDITQQKRLSKNVQHEYAKTAFSLKDPHMQAIALRSLIRHRDFHKNTKHYISENINRITHEPDKSLVTNELNKKD